MPATDALIVLLNSDDTVTQQHAVYTFSGIAHVDPEAVAPAVDALEALCDAEEDFVRENADQALTASNTDS